MEELGWARAMLAPGEYILWHGKPAVKGGLLNRSDFFMIPFSIVWAGFAVFSFAGIITGNRRPIEMLFCGLFLLAAFYITIGRFIIAAIRLHNTEYAITSRQVLICTNRGVEALSRATLPAPRLELRKNGRGTIWFGQRAQYAANGRVVSAADAVGLRNIADVQKVWQILQTPVQ